MSTQFNTKNLGLLFWNSYNKFPERTPYNFYDVNWQTQSTSDIFIEASAIAIALKESGFKKGDCTAFIVQPEQSYHALKFALISLKSEIFPLCAQENIYDLFQKILQSNATTLVIPNPLFLEKIKILSQADPSALQKIKTIIVLDDYESKSNTKALPDINTKSLEEVIELGMNLSPKYQNFFESQLHLLTSDDIVFSFFTKNYKSSALEKTTFKHSHIIFALDNIADAFESNFSKPFKAEQSLSFLSPATIEGQCESLLPFLYDLSIYYTNSFDDSFHALIKIQPTFLYVNAPTFNKILKKALFLNPSKSIEKTLGKKLKKIFILGSLYSERFQDLLLKKNIEVISSFCTPKSPGPLTAKAVKSLSYKESEGRPIGDVELKTHNGQVYASSHAISQDYETESSRYINTEEFGWIDSQGVLYLCSELDKSQLLSPKKIENILSSFPLVESFTLAITQNQEKLGVFVLNKEETISFAAERGIIYSSFDHLIKQPLIASQLDAALNAVNSNLINEPPLKRFTIAPFSWSIESGAISPNLEIQKSILFDKYSYYFDKLLDSEDRFV